MFFLRKFGAGSWFLWHVNVWWCSLSANKIGDVASEIARRVGELDRDDGDSSGSDSDDDVSDCSLIDGT